jgi:hypothetical protein
MVELTIFARKINRSAPATLFRLDSTMNANKASVLRSVEGIPVIFYYCFAIRFLFCCNFVWCVIFVERNFVCFCLFVCLLMKIVIYY